MDPSNLIKGNSYYFGTKKGFQVAVKYVKHTLNYRVFVDNKQRELPMSDSIVKVEITEQSL